MDRTSPEWELHLGEQLRAARVAARLTQSELAESADVSESAVRTLERGAGSTVKTLIAVVRALDRSDWLETLEVPSAVPSPLEQLRAARTSRPRPRRVRRSSSPNT